MNQDLKIIKKEYGEKMMHFCRENFASILETPGLLSKIMLDHFSSNKELFDDINHYCRKNQFIELIYSFVKPDEKIECLNSSYSPKELFNMAGYEFYECHSEEEIQSFKRYFAKGEELCTFKGGRLEKCHVFFVIRKDVDNIKREDYQNPLREDYYGTSVMSIQFTKDASHVLSIKNRYNHTVLNPDATYSNNLERIIPGLTESFAKFYGLNQAFNNTGFELINYVWDINGKYHKYLFEENNVYYCSNNIIIDNFNEVSFEKNRFLLVESYIIDMQKKKIYNYLQKSKDSFPKSLKGIKKITIEKNKANNSKIIHIIQKNGEEAVLGINNNNQIVSYSNGASEYIGNNFLKNNKKLKKLELPNVKIVGNNFLEENSSLNEINIENLYIAGDDFLRFNRKLEEINLPNLSFVGSCFLAYSNLKSINIPSLKKTGYMFLSSCKSLTELEVPNLIYAGGDFLEDGYSLNKIDIGKLAIAEEGFLKYNKDLEYINLPCLLVAEKNFLKNNKTVKGNYPKLLLSEKNFLNDKTKKGRLYIIAELLNFYYYPTLSSALHLDAYMSIAKDNVKKLPRKRN